MMWVFLLITIRDNKVFFVRTCGVQVTSCHFFITCIDVSWVPVLYWVLMTYFEGHGHWGNDIRNVSPWRYQDILDFKDMYC